MSFLDAAAAIGRQVAAEAIWHEDRCAWVAPHVEDDAGREEHRAVGGFVYDGTAGIALFLAQLAAATGEAWARRTALAALRHAASRTGERHDGFYAGTLGIAWAAARIGAVLNEDEAGAAAREIVAAWSGESVPAAGRSRSRRAAPVFCSDLMMGSAGTVAALVGLAGELDDPALLDAGHAEAAALLARAARSARGLSWAQPGRGAPHLIGAAHGAGGIAWALLELDAAAPDERLRTAAGEALAYEDSWLDGAAGEWPDLRHGGRIAAGNTWCYGQAGMALVRLRAAALHDRKPGCSDADIALASATRQFTAALSYAYDDVTLCHGLSGVAHVLFGAGVRDAPERLALAVIDRHGPRGDWPCGPAGRSPTLFRGSTGLGWLFLRLHDPSLPSPLDLPRGG